MPTNRRFLARQQSGDPMSELLQRGVQIEHTPENERAVRRIFNNGIDNEVGGRTAPWLCSFARHQLIQWGLPDPYGEISGG